MAQIGDLYMETVASQSPSQLITRLRRFLQRDDVLQADPDLCQQLNTWAAQPQPSDAGRRARMLGPVRTLRSTKLDATEDSVVPAVAVGTLRFVMLLIRRFDQGVDAQATRQMILSSSRTEWKLRLRDVG